MTRENTKAKNFHISRFFTESTLEAMEEVCRMGASDRESCDDAISRRAALDTLDKMDSVLDEDRTVETYKELLVACYNDLPPVTPTQRWIPCSERLPEEDGDYLLWGKIDEDEDEYTFIGSYDSGCEEFGIWQEQFDRTTLGCLGSDFFEYASVIAWMPLPEPYKADNKTEQGLAYADQDTMIPAT